MLGLIDGLCTFKELSSWDVNQITVVEAVMKQNIGPFKEGDTIPILSLVDKNDVEMYLREYDTDGEIKRQIKVKLVEDS